jgi:hypothetical protein
MHLLDNIQLFSDFSRELLPGWVRLVRELACLKTAPAF